MAKISCDNCGDSVDGLEFCANCGDKVWVAAPEQVAAVVAQTRPPFSWFKDSVKSFFKNYSKFEGRSGVAEVSGPLVMIMFFNQLTNLFVTGENSDSLSPTVLIVGSIQLAVYAALLLPLLAVMTRRFHDTGRSAKNLWFLALPVVGWVLILVFIFTKSEPRANKYGPQPL